MEAWKNMKDYVQDSTPSMKAVRAAGWLLPLAGLAATGCFPVGAYPPASVCAQNVAPLDRPSFAGVSVSAAVPPIVAAEDPQPPSAEAFRDGLEKQLRAVPYFSGGAWPEVTISVTLEEFGSGIGGCWALLIPDVLLFPGW
jgi:hypothetical protein